MPWQPQESCRQHCERTKICHRVMKSICIQTMLTNRSTRAPRTSYSILLNHMFALMSVRLSVCPVARDLTDTSVCLSAVISLPSVILSVSLPCLSVCLPHVHLCLSVCRMCMCVCLSAACVCAFVCLYVFVCHMCVYGTICALKVKLKL